MNQTTTQRVAFAIGVSRGIAGAIANVDGEEPSEGLVASVGQRRQTWRHEAGVLDEGTLPETA